MKLVTAVIKPHMIEPVTSALHAIDVEGITITEVRGHGRQRGHTEVFRGAEYKVDYLPKIRVEIVTDDDEAEKVVATITEAARTGKIGDGKIWVTGVDSVVRIRTGSSITRRSEAPGGGTASAPSAPAGIGEQRAALLADGALAGSSFCRAYTALLDRWVTDLLGDTT